MRAVEFKNKLIFHNDYNKPVPAKGEALVKINMAGICNTDIEILKGYMNFNGILGHEFIGTVEEINDEDQSLLNKRVVGEINCACNNCEYCKKGMPTHCPNRSVLGIQDKNGCFADYITMPITNLFYVPDEIPDEEAVFVEPLAAAFEITEEIHIPPSSKVLILGDGKLGLLIAMALKLTLASITLVGKHPDKINIAKEQGINTMLFENLQIQKDYDFVVEATGTIDGFEIAQSLVKPRGTIVLKSTVAGSKNINLTPLVLDEIKLIGSRCGRFQPAINALKYKIVNVKPLISKKFDFKDAEQAFNLSKTKGILKVLLNFN